MAKKIKPTRSNITETAPEGYRSPLSVLSGGKEKVETTNSTMSSVAASAKHGLKMTMLTIAFIFVILAVLYTSLAGTLMIAAPSTQGDISKTWVARGTFTGGQIKPDTFIYASKSTPASTDFIGKVLEGYMGTNDGFVSQVISGPFNKIATDSKGQITIDGKVTDHVGNVGSRILNNQYLVQCIEGNCKPGEYLIADYSSVVGEARGTVSPFKLDAFTSAKDSTDAKQ